MPALDHPPAEGREGRGGALAVTALLIAAVAYWAPILADPSGRIAGGNGDPLFLAYIVTWVAGHLTDAALWNPPFFHPAMDVLAYSDHLLGMGTLAWPLVQAGAPPVLIINVLAILGAVLTSAAIYWWLRDTRVEAIAAAATALVITYGAWRHLQLAHPQLLFTPFLPLALAFYARAIEGRAGAAAVWMAGALLATQTLFTPSLGVYMMPLTIGWLVVASVLARRTAWPHWLRLAGSMALVGAVNLPIAMHYWRLGDALDRPEVEIVSHSAHWVDWLSAQPHWLYGEALAFTRGRERELFAGIGFIAVTVLGIAGVRRVRSPIIIAGLATAAAALWAATGIAAGGASLAHLPYELFHRVVPGGAQVRVPARFVLPAAIFLAPVVAVGWTRIVQALARRGPGLAPQVAALLLAALVVAEGLAGLAWYEPAAHLSAERVPGNARPGGPAGVPGGAILFVPFGPQKEIVRMWDARLAGVPVVNGYSGHESRLYRQLVDLQAAALDDRARGALYSRLRLAGVATIVDEGGTSALVDRLRLEPLGGGAYRIPSRAGELSGFDRIVMGRDTGLIVAESGWSWPEQSDRESWVWSTNQHATVQVPMDGTHKARISFLARSQTDGADELELWWNGRRLGVQPIDTTPMLHTFRLPAEATAAGWLRLELRGPAPTRLPGNPDVRALSVCLFEIRVE